jgi:hypothetical protein
MGVMGVDEETRLAQADALALTAMRALLTNPDGIRTFTW